MVPGGYFAKSIHSSALVRQKIQNSERSEQRASKLGKNQLNFVMQVSYSSTPFTVYNIWLSISLQVFLNLKLCTSLYNRNKSDCMLVHVSLFFSSNSTWIWLLMCHRQVPVLVGLPELEFFLHTAKMKFKVKSLVTHTFTCGVHALTLIYRVSSM